MLIAFDLFTNMAVYSDIWDSVIKKTFGFMWSSGI